MTKNLLGTIIALLSLCLLASAGLAQDEAAGEAAAAEEGASEDGATIYADNCVRCHGEDGVGATRMGERYEVQPFGADLDADTIRDAVTTGRDNMRPLEDVSDAGIDSLVEYTLTLRQ